MSKYIPTMKTLLSASLFAATCAQAYIEVLPSTFQEHDRLFYITIGGGVADERAGTFNGSNRHASLVDPEKSNAGVGIGAAGLGYAFEEYPFRIELTYNFIGEARYKWDPLEPPVVGGQPEKGEAKVYSHLGLLNFYGDLPITENWIPYLKIGAGYGLNRAKFSYTVEDPAASNDGFTYTSASENTSNFVWNAGAGLNYAFTESVSIGVEILYTFLGKAKANVEIQGENGNPNFEESFTEVNDLESLGITANIAYHFG